MAMPFAVLSNQRQCRVPLYQSFSDKALIRILSIQILLKLFQPSPADKFRRLGRFGLIYLELSPIYHELSAEIWIIPEFLRKIISELSFPSINTPPAVLI